MPNMARETKDPFKRNKPGRKPNLANKPKSRAGQYGQVRIHKAFNNALDLLAGKDASAASAANRLLRYAFNNCPDVTPEVRRMAFGEAEKVAR